ncbi:MAG: tetratricopeptide repeat protein [Pseudomonadota bacterium]
MSNERGFFAELIHRRVPQLLGLYIAGVWLGIEIGNWLIDQFSLPARLPAFLFVFLAILLPSVALLAWRFGAPGKDVARPLDKIWVPVNVVLAAAGVAYMVANPPAPPTSVETAANNPLVDEAEPIAARARVQRVMIFFWRNRTADAPDRIGYALPFLIAEDMDRASSGFVVRTPFSIGGLMENLRRDGFDRMINEPLSVQLREAELRQYNYLLRGNVEDTAEGALKFTYELRDVNTGQAVLSGEQVGESDGIVAIADTVSAELQAAVLEAFDDAPEVQDLPMEESMSDSVDAVYHYVDARIASDIDQDAAQALAELEAAVEKDPMFAEAHGILGITHYLNGNSQPAIASIDTALKYDFRLSRDTEFRLKIARAAIGNDLLAARDIARTWTVTDPNNEAAYLDLARFNRMASLDLDEALRALARVRELNPAATNTLGLAASIEQQRGNLDAASDYVEQLLELEPDNTAAFVQLARIRSDALDFDGALDAYQKARYLDDKSLTPVMGSISVLMRRGDFGLAEETLEQIDTSNLTNAQQMQILNKSAELYGLVGRYSELITVMDQYEQVATTELGPLLYAITFAPQRATLPLQLGASAKAITDALDEQRSKLQEPWPSYLHFYDLAVYSMYDDVEGFQRSMRELEKFIGNQTNDNLRLMIHTMKAQEMMYLEDVDAAVTHINQALVLTNASVLNVVDSSGMFNMRTDMYDLLRQAGNPQAALDGLLSVVKSFPGHGVAHLRLAQTYAALGNIAEARASLDRAREIWRNADATFVMLERVRELSDLLAEGA